MFHKLFAYWRRGCSVDREVIETFLAVYRERGFSSAAKVLHRTQPAISRRIRVLEEELGCRVFERVQDGVLLSQAGSVLLPYAERAHAALEDAIAAVRSLRLGNAGPVSLAMVGTLANRALTDVLKRFARDYPAVDLGLRTARSSEVSQFVRRGDATVGMRYARDLSSDLKNEELGSEALSVVCAHSHPLANSTVASLGDLRHERWLAFPEGETTPEASASHVFGLFLSRGISEVRWSSVDSLTAQKRLVEAGFGIALMTGSSIVEEVKAQTLAAINVTDLHAGLPVYLVTRENGFLSGAAQRLCDLLKTEYAKHWLLETTVLSKARS